MRSGFSTAPQYHGVEGMRRASLAAFAAAVVLIASVPAGCARAEKTDAGAAAPAPVARPGTEEVAVAWSGEGRCAVVQYYREDRYPSVAVWDSRTGDTRVLEKYQVVFAETAAPVLWLEPASAHDGGARTSVDGFADAVDHRPQELVAWDVSRGDPPNPRVSAKWHAWPGPGGYVAYPEVDVLKGAGLAAVWFNNAASSGEGAKAALPDSTVTFSPIGWSPSGAYFAVEELLQEADVATSAPTEAKAPTRKLVVFDAASGQIAATAPLPAFCSGPGAAWDASVDRLYWPDEEERAAGLSLRTMTATGTAGDAFDLLGWQSLPELEGASDAYVVGSDPRAALLAVADGLYRVSVGGLERVGDLDAAHAAVNARGELAMVRRVQDGAARTSHLELVIRSADGERVVWKSQPQAVSE